MVAETGAEVRAVAGLQAVPEGRRAVEGTQAVPEARWAVEGSQAAE